MNAIIRYYGKRKGKSRSAVMLRYVSTRQLSIFLMRLTVPLRAYGLCKDEYPLVRILVRAQDITNEIGKTHQTAPLLPDE